jgi:TolA-binding protein
MRKKITLYLFFIFLIGGIFFVRDLNSKNISQEDQLILVGTGAYKDGFYDIAENQFYQFIKDYPNHGKVYDIYYLLGKTLLNRGKLREAKRVFLKIMNESKNFEHLDYTLFWMTEIEMKLGNREEATRLLLLMIKKFPKFEWIDYSYYLLGLLDFESYKLNLAESSLKKVSLLSKNDALIRSSWFWLGILYYKQDHYETSANYFKMLWEEPKTVPQGYLKYTLFWLGESQLKLGNFTEAKFYYKTFFEQFKSDPFIPEIFWRLGFCEYRLGNFKEAIEIFQTFKKEYKDSRLILYTHYLLGEIFLANRDYPSSKKELNAIFEQSKGNILWGVSALTLFWNYVHLGEMDEANRIFQNLQKINTFEDERIFIQWLNAEMIFLEGRVSDSLPYYFNILNTRYREKTLFKIGKGYFFENKYRETITNLDLLLLEFPNSKYLEESLFMKGECFIQLGDLDNALETYNLVVQQDSSNPWKLFALIQLGSIYFSRDEDEKAELVLKKVIQDFPNHPLCSHAALRLGNLYFKKKNTVEAISYYSMVLKGNIPELFGEASFALGEIFYQQGRYVKALTSFETATQYLKDNSLWFFLTQLEIGNLHKRWGNYEEAKKSYRIVLDRSKDEEIKKAAKELLDHVEGYEVEGVDDQKNGN